MDNIYREARLLLGMTQDDLAHQTGLSRQAVLRTEQGCMPNPPQALTNYFTERQVPGFEPQASQAPNDPCREYHRWRANRQRDHSWILNRSPWTYASSQHYFSPFSSFRRHYVPNTSLTAFCVMLALPITTVRDYDLARTRKMPDVISEALFNLGYAMFAIDVLDAMGVAYYDATHKDD